jgi:hypothetical protein
MTATSLREITLGQYDLERVHVFLANHDDPAFVQITRAHERVHWYLTRRSTFGILTRDIRETIKSKDAGVETSEANRLLAHLMDNSRLVQEATATYVSLVGYDVVDRYLDKLPPYYLSAFRRLDTVVTPCFDIPHERCWMAQVIAILSLSSTIPSGNDNELLQKDFADFIPEEELPNQRFGRICNALHTVPNDYFVTHLRREWPDWDTIPQDKESLRQHILNAPLYIEELLASILFPLLKDALPDAESEWEASAGLWTAYKTAELFGGPAADEADPNAALEALNELSEAVRISDCSPPPNRVLDQEETIISRIVNESVAAFNCVFLYGPCSPGVDNLFLCGLMRGKTHLDLVPLSEAHLNDWKTKEISPITILEEEWWRLLHEGPSDLPITHGGYTFFHLHSNPLAFVRNLLDEVSSINCVAYAVGYATGLLKLEHGLCVILYWLPSESGPPSIFFHLCTVNAVVRLQQYFEARHADKVRWLDSRSSEAPVSADVLAKLVDHSVFFNYYLLNTVLA